MHSDNVWQINIGRDQTKTIDLIQQMDKEAINILALQEPYTCGANRVKCFPSNEFEIISGDQSTRPKAAICIRRSRYGRVLKVDRFTNDWMATAVVHCRTGKWAFSSIYLNLVEPGGRPRDMANDLQLIQELVSYFSNDKLLIMTDANARSPTWGDRVPSVRGRALESFLHHNDLIIHNDSFFGPTFIKLLKNGNTRCSYIDLTISNRNGENLIENWTMSGRVNADHRLIGFKLDKLTSEQLFATHRRFDYRKTDFASLYNTFALTQPNLDETDLDELGNKLMNSIVTAVEAATPEHRAPNRNQSQPWYNEQAASTKRRIDVVRLAMKRTKSGQFRAELSEVLKRLNQHYKHQCDRLKKNYYELKNKVKSKEDLYKLIRRGKTVRPETFSTFTTQEGKETNDLEEITDDILNKFVKKSNNEFELQIGQGEGLRPTDESELKNLMKKVKNKKSPGYDGIGNGVLKYLIKKNLAYFVALFNLLLSSLVYPKSWKIGKLILLPKPGKKLNSASSLRPITLLPGLGKIFEMLLITRINEKLDDMTYFSESQHGFRAYRSTETATRRLIELMRAARKKSYSLLVAVDFSAAFDSIEHRHIYKNLQAAGLGDSELAALKQILTEREVRYEDGHRKRTRKPRVGTPQGSAASPSIWLMGVNDLLVRLERIGVGLAAYADDISLVIAESNKAHFKKKLDLAMKCIESWSSETGVQLNVNKTQAMWLGRQSYDEPIGHNGQVFEMKEEIKYLGLILTRSLGWRKHIDYLEEKNKSQIRLINYVSHLSGSQLTIESKRTIYKTVYLPTILYLNEIWAAELSNAQMERLKKLQRSYLLALSGAYRSTSRVKLMNLLQVLSIEKELRCQSEGRGRGAEEKATIRTEHMQRQLSGYDSFYLLPFDPDLVGLLRSKLSIWFLTGHGPFRTSRGHRGDDKSCRFCGKGLELPEHLLFDCEKLSEFRLDRESIQLEDFERSVRGIVNRMFRQR